MKAMVFAAGLGTRLRPITDKLPKALVPVAGQPLLKTVLERVRAAGIDEVVVNAHHFSEKIQSYLTENDDFGMTIHLSIEKDYPLETGGGIRRAGQFLSGCGQFLAHNVDIISNVNLKDFIENSRKDALATLLVSRRDTQRYLLFDDDMRMVGWTNISTGEVRSPFRDLNPEKCRKYAFGGIHVISDRIFSLMEDEEEVFSIMDFYIRNAAKYPIYGYAPDNLELIDVGKVETINSIWTLPTS